MAPPRAPDPIAPHLRTDFTAMMDHRDRLQAFYGELTPEQDHIDQYGERVPRLVFEARSSDYTPWRGFILVNIELPYNAVQVTYPDGQKSGICVMPTGFWCCSVLLHADINNPTEVPELQGRV